MHLCASLLWPGLLPFSLPRTVQALSVPRCPERTTHTRLWVQLLLTWKPARNHGLQTHRAWPVLAELFRREREAGPLPFYLEKWFPT